MRAVLHAAQLAQDVVVRVPHPQLRRHIELRDCRYRVLLAQRVARHPLEIFLEHRYPGTPAATYPETISEHEYRVQVQAGRPLEILFHQQAWAEPRALTQVDERCTDEVDVPAAPDIGCCGVIPTEDVVALVAREQVQHGDTSVPDRVVIIHPETDIRNEIIDPARRYDRVARTDRVEHGSVQAILRHPGTQAEAQALRIFVIEA